MLSELEAVRVDWELAQIANLSAFMCDMFLDLAPDRALRVVIGENSSYMFWIFCLIQL